MISCMNYDLFSFEPHRNREEDFVLSLLISPQSDVMCYSGALNQIYIYGGLVNRLCGWVSNEF